MEIIQFFKDLEPAVDQVFNFLEGRLGKLILSISILFLAVLINRFMHWRLLSNSNAKEPHGNVRATWVRRKNLVWASAVFLVLALWSGQITGFLISLAAILPIPL